MRTLARDTLLGTGLAPQRENLANSLVLHGVEIPDGSPLGLIRLLLQVLNDFVV